MYLNKNPTSKLYQKQQEAQTVQLVNRQKNVISRGDHYHYVDISDGCEVKYYDEQGAWYAGFGAFTSRDWSENTLGRVITESSVGTIS